MYIINISYKSKRSWTETILYIFHNKIYDEIKKEIDYTKSTLLNGRIHRGRRFSNKYESIMLGSMITLWMLNPYWTLNNKQRPAGSERPDGGGAGGSAEGEGRNTPHRGKSLLIRCEQYHINHSFVILMRILLHCSYNHWMHFEDIIM